MIVRCALSALALAAVAACVPRQQRLQSSVPEYTPPRTFTVLGDWVLATPPDSTAFRGAEMVKLSLAPASFVITAVYPGRPPVVISGDAEVAPNGGVLALTPRRTIQGGLVGPANPAFVSGRTITVIASAAGPTMVFGQPGDRGGPTSVWARPAEAEAAGIIDPPEQGSR